MMHTSPVSEFFARPAESLFLHTLSQRLRVQTASTHHQRKQSLIAAALPRTQILTSKLSSWTVSVVIIRVCVLGYVLDSKSRMKGEMLHSLHLHSYNAPAASKVCSAE